MTVYKPIKALASEAAEIELECFLVESRLAAEGRMEAGGRDADRIG